MTKSDFYFLLSVSLYGWQRGRIVWLMVEKSMAEAEKGEGDASRTSHEAG